MTYGNCQDFFADFQRWLEVSNSSTTNSAKQIVSNLKEIWQKLDPHCNVTPNKLASYEDLEDVYFLPIFMNLKENIRRTDNSRKFLKASTIMGKLGSLRHLIRFLKSREIFLGNFSYQLNHIRDSKNEI